MLFLAAAILVASYLFSMVGQGGGAIYTPIQVWFGVDFHVAATTSLFLIIVTSISATLVYRKAQKIDWPLAFALEPITMLSSFFGGYYSKFFSSSHLILFFACIITYVGIFLIWSPHRVVRHTGKGWRRQLNGNVYYINLPLAFVICIIAGAVSGLLGIGGGILKVPMMVLLLGVPMDIAVGSSAFMVGITALGGFTGHLIQGEFDWYTSCVLAVLAFVGARLGSQASVLINTKNLKRTCGVILLVVACTLLFQVVWHL
jgi:uncharacterized membrane protein YfcA